MLDAFGVFEGGGAKGLAHVGALKACEDLGINFLAVGGTSAGAIIAALVAAKYKADEIYKADTDKEKIIEAADPFQNPGPLFCCDFTKFFEADALIDLYEVNQGLRETFSEDTPGSCGIARFLWKYRKQLELIKSNLGILKVDRFENWLNKKLLDAPAVREKIGSVSQNHAVTFKDLPRPLAIVAANVSAQSVSVFSHSKTGNFPVAKAVAASIAIPFVFEPVTLEMKSDSESTFVDGGIRSNFPAWLFDEERKHVSEFTPTFGFRLVSTQARGSSTGKYRFGPYARDLFHTAVFGDNSLEVRAIGFLHEIPLKVSIGPLDFDIPKETKDAVYKSGKADAKEYLQRNVICHDPVAIRKVLEIVVANAVRQEINHRGHLRVNVMRPTFRDTLKVVYTCNMDGEDDCDDQIEFKRGVGACGLCWERHEAIACNLSEAKITYAQEWRMSKHQQRLVRSSLRSLFSVPIYNPKLHNPTTFDPNNDEMISRREAAFLGVLNFDSDEDVLDKFKSKKMFETSEYCANLIAEKLFLS